MTYRTLHHGLPEASYAGNWWGYTYAQWDSNRYFISGAVNIHLNTLAPNKLAPEPADTVPEIGHVLGLGHPQVPGGTPPIDPNTGVPTGRQTCIGPLDLYTNKNPHSADISVLRNILCVKPPGPYGNGDPYLLSPVGRRVPGSGCRYVGGAAVISVDG